MNALRWLRCVLCPLLRHRPLPWERRVKITLGGDALWVRWRCGWCGRWLPYQCRANVNVYEALVEEGRP